LRLKGEYQNIGLELMSTNIIGNTEMQSYTIKSYETY